MKIQTNAARAALLAWVLSTTAHAAATLEADTQPVVLGKTESVALTLRIDEPKDGDERPLMLAVNVGSFGELRKLSPGVYSTVYVPPATRFPQVALIAIWRETGPDAPIEFLRLPLYGTTRVEVSARNGSVVSAVIGSDPTPPQKVRKDRKVELPLVVPPGHSTALIVVAEPKSPTVKREVPINVPPYNRLTAGLVPHAIAADGESFARLDVFYDLGGADTPATAIKVKASAGEAKFVRAERGRYVYRYVAPRGTDATAVTFDVSVDGDPAAQARAQLEIGLPPVARLVLRPPPEKLKADGKSAAAVEVLAFDAKGLGLPAKDLTVTANGAPLGAVEYVGAGLHRATFTAPSDFPAGGLVQMLATVASSRSVSASANYQLLPPPAPGQIYARFQPGLVPADGRTAAKLVLDVRDANGLPLAGSKLIAVATHGAASVIKEVGAGSYEATYIGPPQIPDGDVQLKLVDSAGTFEQAVHVPLREDAGALLVGVRAGMNHDLLRFTSPRLGLDVWAHLGRSGLGLGLLATVGQASQQFGDDALSNRSEVLFVPIAARLGYEVAASRYWSLHVGAGPSATWARFRSSLAGVERQRFGFGGHAFVSGARVMGPGQVFAELSYTYAPVRAPDFELDSGGLGVGLGYRFGLF